MNSIPVPPAGRVPSGPVPSEGLGSGLYALALARPWPVLWAVLAVLVLVGAQARHLEIESSIDFLSPEDPVAAADRQRLEIFGEDLRLVVGLYRPAKDGGLLTPDGLEALRNLHRWLEAEPGIESVSSLANASIFVQPPGQGMGAEGMGQVGEPLLDDAALADPDLLRRRWRAARLQSALLLSPRESLAPFYLGLEPGVDEADLARRLAALAQRFEAEASAGLRMLVTGPARVETGLALHVLGDLGRLVPFTALLIALGLGLYLRRPIYLGVVVAHIVALEALVLGGMGALGWRIDLVSVLAPVIALPVGIADLLHLCVHLRAQSGSSASAPARLRRAFDALRAPMLATTLTTGLGFLGFVLSPVEAIRRFGAVLAVASVAALLVTFTLDAALLALGWRPTAPTPASVHRRRSSSLERWLVGLGRSAPRRRWQSHLALGVFLAVGAVGALALPRIAIDDTWLRNFDPDSRIRRDALLFESELIGTNTLSVVFEADPRVPGSRQRLIDVVNRFTRAHLSLPSSRGVLSATLLARTLDPAQGQVWQPWPTPSPEALADVVETWRRRGLARPAMASFVDADLEHMQVQIFVLQLPYAELVEEVERVRGLAAGLAGPGVRTTVSGDLATNVRMVRRAVEGQVRSLLLLLALVILLLVLDARSVVVGLLLVLPMALAILLSHALLVAADLPYGIAVSMFPTLVVGLSVDFAIHLRAAWSRGQPRGSQQRSTTAHARRLALVLRGILLNGALWAAGFALLTVSSLPPNRDLGLLAATVLGASTLFTLLLVPILERRRVLGDSSQ